MYTGVQKGAAEMSFPRRRESLNNIVILEERSDEESGDEGSAIRNLR